MKVTQVIKEAITARVNAKCAEANKDYVQALNTELDRLAEERKQHANELMEEYHKAFLAMLKKMDDKKISYLIFSGYSGVENTDKDFLWEKNQPDLYLTVTSDYAKDLKAKIRENRDRAKKFINDIILELELGESKPTLESLLANVKF